MDTAQCPENVTPCERGQLASARWRYLCFTGLVAGASLDLASERQAELDRRRYPHLLRYTPDGTPWLYPVLGAQFMAAVSGLPAAFCSAYLFKIPNVPVSP